MAAAESSVWTWGRAKNYRLGRAFVGTDARIPEKVSGFEGVSVRQAACGGGHTAVVLSDSRLFVFGYSQYGQLGLGDRNDMCDATQVYLIAPTIESDVREGMLRNGIRAPPMAPSASTTEPAANSRDNPRAGCLPVAEVACGRYHTIARTECGLVFTWGGGKNGRLGHGDEKIRAQATCVQSFIGDRTVKLTAGYHNNLVLTERGEVWSWGWGAHGQLGLGDTKDRDQPTVIQELSAERICVLSCGDRHSFAITEEGKVLGWGSNEFGQLGRGRKRDTILRPVVIEGLQGLKVVGISSGDRHSAAITNTGAVYTWGCGSDGQCGHGGFDDVVRPKLVEKLVGKFVTDVKCGHNFTMVLTSEDEVLTWGNNTYGQLGNNGNGKSESAVKVIINSSAKLSKVSCGHFHCIMWMEVADGKNEGSAVAKRRLDGNSRVGQQVQEARERLVGLLKAYMEKRHECEKFLDAQRKKDRADFD